MSAFAGLQSIPGDLKYKDTATMLVEQTREANEEYLVIRHQHGRHDVTCKPTIHVHIILNLHLLWVQQQQRLLLHHALTSQIPSWCDHYGINYDHHLPKGMPEIQSIQCVCIKNVEVIKCVFLYYASNIIINNNNNNNNFIQVKQCPKNYILPQPLEHLEH